jgi:hypothetical protein
VSGYRRRMCPFREFCPSRGWRPFREFLWHRPAPCHPATRFQGCPPRRPLRMRSPSYRFRGVQPQPLPPELILPDKDLTVRKDVIVPAVPAS